MTRVIVAVWTAAGRRKSKRMTAKKQSQELAPYFQTPTNPKQMPNKWGEGLVSLYFLATANTSSKRCKLRPTTKGCLLPS